MQSTSYKYDGTFKSLSYMAQLLFYKLEERQDFKTHTSFYSIKKLLESTGFKRTTLFHALDELEYADLIHRHPLPHSRMEITLTYKKGKFDQLTPLDYNELLSENEEAYAEPTVQNPNQSSSESEPDSDQKTPDPTNNQNNLHDPKNPLSPDLLSPGLPKKVSNYSNTNFFNQPLNHNQKLLASRDYNKWLNHNWYTKPKT